MTPIKTPADVIALRHGKLLEHLDRAHRNMHAQLPAPTSAAYESIALDMKDAMDAAEAVSSILREKGL